MKRSTPHRINIGTPLKIMGLALLFAVLLAGPTRAKASDITWGSPTIVNSSDPTQVITDGTLFDSASAYSSAALTINGVTFNPYQGYYASGDSGAAFVLSFLNSGITIGSDGAVAAGGAASGSDYATLLDIATYIYSQRNLNPFITINGLTLGQQYEVQLWTPFWADNWPTQFSDGTTAVHMDNTGNNPTFVTGTFTADASGTEKIYWGADGRDYAVFSAMQVRTIPEPGTWVLVGCGLLGMLLLGRCDPKTSSSPNLLR